MTLRGAARRLRTYRFGARRRFTIFLVRAMKNFLLILKKKNLKKFLVKLMYKNPDPDPAPCSEHRSEAGSTAGGPQLQGSPPRSGGEHSGGNAVVPNEERSVRGAAMINRVAAIGSPPSYMIKCIYLRSLTSEAFSGKALRYTFSISLR